MGQFGWMPRARPVEIHVWQLRESGDGPQDATDLHGGGLTLVAGDTQIVGQESRHHETPPDKPVVSNRSSDLAPE
jgi:hypothetical protein